MIISADDYGISLSVGQAIRDLADKNRISATSCMMTCEHSLEELVRLREYKDKLDIGLHIDLTEGPKAHFSSFKSLVLAAHLKRIDRKLVKKEIKRQIELFTETFGQSPDHLDGHQHVHQLPIIRDLLLEVYREMNLESYIRVFSVPSSWMLSLARRNHMIGICLESLIIQSQGRALIKKLDAQNIPRNHSICGHYSYTRPLPFSVVMNNYLTLQPSRKDIFLCHPGHQDEWSSTDVISYARKDCVGYLLSDEFESLGVCINRFNS